MGACTPGPQSPSISAVSSERRLRTDEQTEQGRASAAEGSITSQGPVQSQLFVYGMAYPRVTQAAAG